MLQLQQDAPEHHRRTAKKKAQGQKAWEKAETTTCQIQGTILFFTSNFGSERTG